MYLIDYALKSGILTIVFTNNDHVSRHTGNAWLHLLIFLYEVPESHFV